MFKYKNSYYDTDSESNESSLMRNLMNLIIAVLVKLAKKIITQNIKRFRLYSFK